MANTEITLTIGANDFTMIADAQVTFQRVSGSFTDGPVIVDVEGLRLTWTDGRAVHPLFERFLDADHWAEITDALADVAESEA